jgi:hypothetical protein
MVTVFLSGLSSCLGAGDTIAAQVRENLRNGFPVEEGSDTLPYNRAIRHCDGDPYVVRAATFVAGDGNTVTPSIGCG